MYIFVFVCLLCGQSPVYATDNNSILLTMPAILANADTTTTYPEVDYCGAPCSSTLQTVTYGELQWQHCGTGAVDMYNWEMAINYCSNLILDGHTDWRLPTKDELKSLVTCSNGHPIPLDDHTSCSSDGYGTFTSPTIDLSLFSSHCDTYWSSSVDDLETGEPWYVNFRDGSAYASDGSDDGHVRCVR